MLRNIKLSVDNVYINPGSSLSHTGTSYQVSKTPDFSVVGNLVLNIANSSTSLLEHMFTYDMGPSTPLYVRTRYHFNNNKVSDWSNIIELSSTQEGIKSSDTLISTPSIIVTYDYATTRSGELVVNLKNLNIQAGIGNIISVSWKIETTDGEVLYELPDSTDVQTELRLPLTTLNNVPCFMVTAIANTDTSASSNTAREISISRVFDLVYFKAAIHGSLYADYHNFITISDPIELFISSDVRIMSANGLIVDSYTTLGPNVAGFRTTAVTAGEYYTVDIRLRASSDVYTPWINVYTGNANSNYPRIYSDTINYVTSNMGFGGYYNLNGLSSQSVQADEDGIFYLATPETNTLEAYKVTNGALFNIGKSHDLGIDQLHNIPTFNSLKTYRGDLLIDHAMGLHNGNYEVPKFHLMDYNLVTKSMSNIHSLIREDERYGTGRTNSAVVRPDGKVYYIPGRIVDAGGVSLDLEMRIYDSVTNAIVGHIPLPVSGIKLNASLTEDSNGDLYFFGGSSDATKSNVDGSLWATPMNHVMHKYTISTGTWSTLASAPIINTDMYRYKLQTLRNGRILIIDATPNLISGGVRHSYIYNPNTNTYTSTIVNNPQKEHLGISIELPGGDIGLMTSTPDLVEATSFLVTTVSDAHLTAQSLLDSQRVLDLVVAQGDTVYLRDPYRYRSIDIQGTNMANTGTIIWERNGVRESYHYNDRIITRNTTITTPALGTPPTYNKLTITGNAVVTLISL